MESPPIIETCLYAEDLAAAERFYANILGLDIFARVEGRHVSFRAGNAVFLIFNPNVTEKASIHGIPAHGARGAGHAAFRMEEQDIQPWRERLAQHQVPIESEYRWPNGGLSFYFRDPAGNSIELTTPQTWNL